MSRDVRPIEAAERRQILAPGASPGFFGQYGDEPRRGDRFLASLSPLRGSVLNDTLTTAFRPWLRSVAALRLNHDAAFAAIFVPTHNSRPSHIWTVLPILARPIHSHLH